MTAHVWVAVASADGSLTASTEYPGSASASPVIPAGLIPSQDARVEGRFQAENCPGGYTGSGWPGSGGNPCSGPRRPGEVSRPAGDPPPVVPPSVVPAPAVPPPELCGCGRGPLPGLPRARPATRPCRGKTCQDEGASGAGRAPRTTGGSRAGKVSLAGLRPRAGSASRPARSSREPGAPGRAPVKTSWPGVNTSWPGGKSGWAGGRMAARSRVRSPITRARGDWPGTCPPARGGSGRPSRSEPDRLLPR